MDPDRRRQYAELAARLRLAEATKEEPVSEGTLVIPTAAADIGNATAIVAAVIGGKLKLLELPTAKATFGLRMPAQPQRDDVFYQNGAGLPVALGLSALRYADEPVAARGHSDRYGPFTKEFALAAVAMLARSERVVIQRLAVLLPEKHASTEVLGVLTKALTGKHTFSVGGVNHQVEVKRVVPTMEGEAAWHYLAAGHQGNTIVLDGGGGTTNIALGRAGKFYAVRTRDTGLQRAWDALDEQLKRAHDGRMLSALERYELERALATNQNYSIIIRGQRTRIDELARALITHIAPTIAADAKERVPNWRSAEAVYYCGGQALHLKEAMTAEFGGSLIIPSKPTEANVRGALKMLGTDAEGEVDHAAA